MINIKMKPNSTVTYYWYKLKEDDCLLVDNYVADNDIWHFPIDYGRIKQFKSAHSIGCWRIKELKII